VKSRFIVVAYDVSSNRRRLRLSHYLQTYGSRINLSVFECSVPSSEVREFKQKVAAIVRPATDTVVFYDLCLDCIAGIDRIGVGARQADPSAVTAV